MFLAWINITNQSNYQVLSSYFPVQTFEKKYTMLKLIALPSSDCFKSKRIPLGSAIRIVNFKDFFINAMFTYEHAHPFVGKEY